MTLEDPETYAEWYWKQGLDQLKAFDELTEKGFASVYSSIFADIPEIDELPVGIANLMGLLSKPTSPGFGGFAIGVGVETIDEVLHVALGPIMTMLKRSYNRRSKETWPTSEEAITLAQRKRMTDEYFYDIMASEGYEKIIADVVYESKQPFPSIPELITYARYHGDPNNPRDVVLKRRDISPIDYDLWNWLSLQKLSSEQVTSLYKRGFIIEFDAKNELAELGWSENDRNNVLELSYLIPNPMLLAQGDLLQEISDDDILKDISKADIHPMYAQNYYDAIRTKPATDELIAYELRKDPTLANLSRELRKIGIHPDYFNLHKELAYPIPPVADIITMAVREAFTPEIAARFGQYEGLPAEYVEWAKKKGLSEEWATRYWASHWTLPSAQQGFEMLHRGIIDRDDLTLLLRALDIMPFWRERLIQMSYRPLTRVDVRRMYNLDILDPEAVRKAYKDLGYDDTNAEYMTRFTVRIKEEAEKREQERKERALLVRVSPWTTAQTLSFLKRGLITRERAIEELSILGYDGEHINVYLASVEQQP